MVKIIGRNQEDGWRREPHYLERENEEIETDGIMIIYDYENWCLSLEDVVLTRAGETIQYKCCPMDSLENLEEELEASGYIGRKRGDRLVDIYKNKGRKPYIATISIMGLGARWE